MRYLKTLAPELLKEIDFNDFCYALKISKPTIRDKVKEIWTG